jgi:2-oxoisovalerate dehydrogenase E1 component alpha subunit
MTLVEPPNTLVYNKFLPANAAVQYLDAVGRPVKSDARYPRPNDHRLLEMHRQMVLGRRFDQQATALSKQGRVAVYPSSRGQEAVQISAAMSLESEDWMFPTYRDSVSVFTRGVDPVELLSSFSGEWHCNYNSALHRTAPQCTPLATQMLHAAGAAYGELRRESGAVALALCGDGGSSEGDFHEALNFAAVFKAPVVFLIQNNGFAISVPFERQSAAPSLAHKGVGYGVGSELVDGNDPMAMLAVMDEAVAFARNGNGPVIVEALTYRIEAHTNADDATRYRESAEVHEWMQRDPILRAEKYLRSQDLIDDAYVDLLNAEAESVASAVRAGMARQSEVDPRDLFKYVFACPTSQLKDQQRQMEAELVAEKEG